MARIGQRITPFLWYDDNAEDAAKFYVSVFANSRILSVSRYNADMAKAAGRPVGSAMTVAFELSGQAFTAINGGPVFKLSEAVSFMVTCDSQEEVDHYWNTLSAGGQESQCGWLKDKFGLSWQITPTALMEMIQDKDQEKAGRALAAMLKMRKLDLPTLQRAYEGR